MADQVLEFVPAEATSEQWARWHRFRKRWHEASWPEDPYQPDWLEEAELKRPNPFTISQRFVRVREGEIVTAFVLQSTAPESPPSSGRPPWTIERPRSPATCCASRR